MSLPYLITLTLPTGNTYELRDQGARDLIQELMNFNEWLGVTTSAIEDGSTTNPVIINGEEVTATAGDVVSRDSDGKDFIFSSTGVWQNFGNLSGLGALAFKNSASGDYTPQGSVAAPTFTGQSTTSTGKFTPQGSVAAPTFTGEATTSTGKFTPQGSVAAPTFTGQETTSTGTFTPEGSISGIAAGTKTIKQFKTQGEMPTYTVTDHNLIIGAGTLPTGEDVTVGDGSISSQGTFTGTAGNLSVKGTPLGSNSAPAFTGTEGDLSVTGTPLGSNSAPAFTGTEGDLSVTGTPLGSNSAPAFTGTQAVITVS